MAELKTQKNSASVLDFINSVEDQVKRNDSLKLLEVFKECTGEAPVMWGTSIVGFGEYHYKSDRSSQEGDWMMTGFSPRKQNLTLYIMPGFERYKNELAKLGKHKTSISCLYIKRLADVDENILKNIIIDAFESMKRQK